MTRKKFEITSECNLGCEVCYNRESDFAQSQIELILQSVNPGDHVYIGGGEPMMHPRITELSQRLIDVPTNVLISTNGIIYRQIPKEVGMQVSMWTLDSANYQRITNGAPAQLESVQQNLESYIAEGHFTVVNMPVYDRNVEDIESLSDYTDSLEVLLRVNPISPANGFSTDAELIKRIERTILDLKLQGRQIDYSRQKNAVATFYQKNEVVE